MFLCDVTKSNVVIRCHRNVTSMFLANSYPCSQASITGVNSTTPTVAGQDGDEGDEIEKCGDQREDDFHHQKLEGEFHLRTFSIKIIL